MPDAVILTLIGIFFAGIQVWINYSRSKREVSREEQQKLDSKLEDVKGAAERGQADLTLELGATEKRVRKLESIQITEARVQSILENKVQPLESEFRKLGDSFNKLEETMQSHHKGVSDEIKRASETTNNHIMRLIEDLSYLSGTLESRRKDDSRRD